MRIKSWFIAGIASVLLASCAEEIINENTKYMRHHGLNIEVVDGGFACTRANYSGFPGTTFETGDAIGVYVYHGGSYEVSNMRFVKQADGSWLPDEEIPYAEYSVYLAYFPYRATTYTPAAYGGSLEYVFADFIEDNDNYFWQANQSTKAGFTYSNLMIAEGEITNVASDAVTVKFTMQHKRGLALFTEEAPDATFTGNIPYISGLTGQFLMKPFETTSFTDDKGTYTLYAPAGEYITHDVVLSTDLSMVDNAGNESARTTANCYLVHEAGKYKLPLVYGNAIKDGTTNTKAFTYTYPYNYIANGAEEELSYLSRLVNHADVGITGPWITKSTSGTGVNKGMGLTAASAELLWQDVQGLITSVSVDGDFLKFTVGTFNPGNAVIAVKNSSGTILWSWHIWATEEDLTNTIRLTEGTHNYDLSPVVLGWVPTGAGGKKGYHTYYQWGRKDPIIPTTDEKISTTNKTVYNISGSVITGLTYEQNNSATIGTNIQNPMKFYFNNSTYTSMNNNYSNLWNSGTYYAPIKTVYDPCPPGFVIPARGFISDFAGGSGASWEETDDYLGMIITVSGENLFFPWKPSRMYEGGNPYEAPSWWFGSVYDDYVYDWNTDPYIMYWYLALDGDYGFNSSMVAGASGNLVRPILEE